MPRLVLGRLAPASLAASFFLLAAVAASCAREPIVLRDPDPTAAGALGEDGPRGVLLVERRVRVRVDEVVDVDVLLPLSGDGSRMRRRPVVLLLHGGLVARDRYRWLGEHLASRGFAVIAPGHAFDLAFFEQGNVLDVLATLRAAARRGGDVLAEAFDDGPVAVIGHSLGGVVAAGAWDASPGTVSHLGLLASYPEHDRLAVRSSGRALSIVGSADARVSEARAGQGVRALETSGVAVAFAVIEGMDHMQVADRVTASEAASAGTPSIDAATARARTVLLLDALLEHFETGASATLDDPSRWPVGVREGVRP